MANGNFAGGDGTESNPFLVEDYNDLNEARNKPAHSHFKQISNIDLNGINWTSLTSRGENSFQGSYDGKNLKISNINAPLFGNVNNNSLLKNIVIENADVSTTSSEIPIGILANQITESSIINCKVKGTVNGKRNVGGLVGRSQDSNISYCETEVDVYGYLGVGGLIGFSAIVDTESSFIVEKCSARGNINAITGEGPTGGHIGGLIGDSDVGLKNCYCDINIIEPNDTNCRNIGGLVGYLDIQGSVENCYVLGSIKSWDSFGGLAGQILNNKTEFKNNFNFLTSMEAIAEYNPDLGIAPTRVFTICDDIHLSYTATNCYYNQQMQFIGYEHLEVHRQGDQINFESGKVKSTYENNDWDFEKVWKIEEGNFPTLQPYFEHAEYKCKSIEISTKMFAL